MTENILEFPDQKAIEEEAAAWLIKLDGDEPPTREELAALREWLARRPAHRETLDSLVVLWDKMNVLTELAVPLGKSKDKTAHGFARFFGAGARRYRRYAIAATILITAVTAGLILWNGPDPYVAGNGLYATAVGQQETTTLVDGSVVVLNTNSQIDVVFGDEYREVRLLQGEAHFTIAKNADRPFRVYAGGGRVQAVGTAFSVYLKDNAVQVLVTEGKVALASISTHSTNQSLEQRRPPGVVQSPGSAVIVDDVFVEDLGTIRAGESALIESIGSPYDRSVSRLNAVKTVEANEMARRLSWREGILTFSGDPLEVVVDEISRYTTLSIEISDPAVRAIKIGGRFPVGETEAMFNALETNFGLRVTRVSHDHVLLSRAPD